MRCPYCNNLETGDLDSRDSEDLTTIRRRRECLKCQKRFTTYERVEMIDLVVIKKDGRREPFGRNKVLSGIIKACEKRLIPIDVIERIVDDIERDLRNRDSVEIESKLIGSLVMRKLKSIDKVAYIRFASVYRSFEDVEEFEKEAQLLK